jgi:hypothetical protein
MLTFVPTRRSPSLVATTGQMVAFQFSTGVNGVGRIRCGQPFMAHAHPQLCPGFGPANEARDSVVGVDALPDA